MPALQKVEVNKKGKPLDHAYSTFRGLTGKKQELRGFALNK